MGLFVSIMAGKSLQAVFFGRLRAIEVEVSGSSKALTRDDNICPVSCIAPLRKVLVRGNGNLPGHDDLPRRIQSSVCGLLHHLAVSQDLPLAVSR